MCSICSKPFSEPVSTSCDHTFCRECISLWITKKKKSCPTCRQQIKSDGEFTQVSRPLRNMLDRLPIKCSHCGQKGLQRDNYNDHINKICLKKKITCTAADIKCDWSGLREELQKHLTLCKFEPLRPLLTELITTNQQFINQKQKFITDNEQLTEQNKKYNIQINELTNKLSIVNNVLPSLEKFTEGQSNSIIDFSQQNITDRSLTNIIQKMMNKNYSVIQLQGNVITSQGITDLIQVLLHNSTTLIDLWLSNNCISDLGVETLFNSYLSTNPTLKQLHLGSNCIGDRGVEYITCMLAENRKLTDLWLYNNNITDNSARKLTNVLRQVNRTLKHLDLQWNKSITDSSVECFVIMLKCNQTLERLNLRKCGLSINGKMQLLQAVAEKKDFKLYI
ncbi:unnamed protein product [Adineta steineri]|uniref:RING-type domain-containing protein n=1 Tax=Adineta steineri TaxID=433720 RepID=A0A814IK69_9BILA|nr:unnamed protein product [Adineta steineri]